MQYGSLLAARNFNAAIPVLLDTWQRWPERAEALHELARHFCDAGDARLAYLFADLGLQLPGITDGRVIQKDVYDWGLRFQRGRAALGLGRTEESLADLRAVLDIPGLPEPVASYIRAQLDSPGPAPGRSGGSDPVRAATTLAALVGGLRLGRLALTVPTGWPAFNPSIAADADGFLLLVRTESGVTPDGEAGPLDQPLREAYVVRLDGRFAVTGMKLLDGDPESHTTLSRGFLDLQPVLTGGRWLAVGHRAGPNGSGPEPALIELDGTAVTRVHRLAGPEHPSTTQQWMPFVQDGRLHLLSVGASTVVHRFDPADGSLSTVAELAAAPVISALGGGSQGVPLEDGSFLFVHARGRDHRWAILLAPPAPLVTRPRDRSCFAALHVHRGGRRPLAGAAVRGDELVVSFGVGETEAWLTVMPLDAALGLLEPVAR